jgi:hypothetical protein
MNKDDMLKELELLLFNPESWLEIEAELQETEIQEEEYKSALS